MPQPTPLNYKIHLEPDLVNFRFAGVVELLCEAATPVKEISLNILELAISSCRLRQAEHWGECPFCVDPAKEKIRIFLPAAATGRIGIKIEYLGFINDKMAGFYRSRYVSQGMRKFIAVTQFEESDARRAFPCMDHPARKATFDIEIDIEPAYEAISNGAVQSVKVLANGKKRVKFEQTPRMSTYLVFFGVGEFELIPDSKDRRVRVAALPGMKPYAGFGLEFGRKCLAFSESYYGIDYPLSKLDLIAIPDFAFGAMENWGAITFRENLLLFYPAATSRSGQERIYEVIAHEIAHQWFGNLVTPADWKYLWLNESFATYFGYGVVDHYHPDWDTWQQFLHGNTGTAMARDSLHETFPIEIPGGEHVVINASTAPIIYSKGGSILRQIQGFIGEENFRRGLHDYLKTHAYGCAASHHLWESFDRVSGQPVSAMMQSWIEQPGLPMIEARRAAGGLVLSQKRFTFLPNSSDQLWRVPVAIVLFAENGALRRLTVLLDTAEKTVGIPDGVIAYKLNDRQTGFYRVKYADSQNRDALGRRVQDKTLPPEDRWGLHNDFFALVKGGEARLADYLQLLEYYEKEDAFLPLISIAVNLAEAYRVLPEMQGKKIAELAVPWFENLLATIGYEPAAAERHTTAALRERLLWDAAVYGSEPAIQFGRQKFDALTEGQSVHPDLMKTVMQIGALTGGDQAFDWFDRRLQACKIEHERMNILTALGCFKRRPQIAAVQEYVLEKVPPRNKFVPVVAMAANPHAAGLMWDWYISRREQFEQFHPMLYERVVAAVIPAAGIEKSAAVKAFFKQYLEKNDRARDIIRLSLERLEVYLRMRNAD